MKTLVFRPRNEWPSETWEDIPKGSNWLSLLQCPVPYIWIRETDNSGSERRVWVGSPIQIDPRSRHEIRNIANTAIDLVSNAGAAGDLVFQDRRTVIGLADFPIPRGEIVLRYSFLKVQTAALTTVGYIRFTTPINWFLRMAAVTDPLTYALPLFVEEDTVSPADSDILAGVPLVAGASLHWKHAQGQLYEPNTGYALAWAPAGIQPIWSMAITVLPKVVVTYRGVVTP